MRILSRCLFSFAYNTFFPSSFRLFFRLLAPLSGRHCYTTTVYTGKISSREDSINYSTPSGIRKHFEYVSCYCCVLSTSFLHIDLYTYTAHRTYADEVRVIIFYIKITIQIDRVVILFDENNLFYCVFLHSNDIIRALFTIHFAESFFFFLAFVETVIANVQKYA